LKINNVWHARGIGSCCVHSIFVCLAIVSARAEDNKIVTLRPELRFDHFYDAPAFNNGTRNNQFVASMDFIIQY